MKSPVSQRKWIVAVRFCALFSLVLWGFSSNELSSQQRQRHVTGQVIDSASRRPLAAATILAAGFGQQFTTVTNDRGTFALTVPVAPITLLVRAIGYKRRELVIPLSESSVQVALEPHPLQLEGVVVVGSSDLAPYVSLNAGPFQVSGRGRVDTLRAGFDSVVLRSGQYVVATVGSAANIETIPVLSRNFLDLAALAPVHEASLPYRYIGLDRTASALLHLKPVVVYGGGLRYSRSDERFRGVLYDVAPV